MCRLGHKKSRKGCISCKRRRVKCDEQAPCRNCVRRGEQCSLLLPSPSSTSGDKSNASTDSETWLQDLGLMRHFVKETTHDLVSPRQEIQRLWQEVITDLALRYPLYVLITAAAPFESTKCNLMHGVLAFSALHLAHLDPSETEHFLQLCDNHQTKALETFRSILASDLSAEMASPMFALASCISISSMARSCAIAQTLPEPRYVDIDQVTELFFLIRGVRDVVLVCREWISAGPLSIMLDGHDLPQGVDMGLPESVKVRHEKLGLMIDEVCENEEQRQVCKEALQHLKSIQKNIVFRDARNELQVGHVWNWMTAVPTEYVLMIRARSYPALILLGDFAAASLAISGEATWYTHYWGQYCLEGISMALREYGEPKWLDGLDWSKEHAANNMAILRPSDTPK